MTTTAGVYQSPLEVEGPVRLRSLDVFRGATICFMTLVNNSEGGDAYAALKHASWHGWTATDLVFPFFLFIVGVAIPYSLSKRSAGPKASRGTLLAHIWARALAIFMLGWIIHSQPLGGTEIPAEFRMLKILRVLGYVILYGSFLALLIPWPAGKVANLVPVICAALFVTFVLVTHYALKHPPADLPKGFSLGGGILRPDRLRIPGVLQRIGLCYGIAASIALFAGWRTILIAAFALLALYGSLLRWMPFPDHVTGSLTKQDNVQRKIDEAVFDRYEMVNGKKVYTQRHTYSYPDPEGLLGTIPSISTALLGVLVGLWLRTHRSAMDRCAGMMAVGAIAVLVGSLLDGFSIPINKQMWTPSYVILTAGLAMIGLGMLYWIVDIQGYKAWAWPFAVVGMNAIALYALSECLDILFDLIQFNFRGERMNPLEFMNHFYRSEAWNLTKANAALMHSLTFVAAVMLVGILLHKLKIHLKV